MTARTAVESPSENSTPRRERGGTGTRRTARLLTDTFGAEFSILDGDSGDLLHTAAAHRGLDWLVRAELCRTGRPAARARADRR